MDLLEELDLLVGQRLLLRGGRLLGRGLGRRCGLRRAGLRGGLGAPRRPSSWGRPSSGPWPSRPVRGRCRFGLGRVLFFTAIASDPLCKDRNPRWTGSKSPISPGFLSEIYHGREDGDRSSPRSFPPFLGPPKGFFQLKSIRMKYYFKISIENLIFYSLAVRIARTKNVVFPGRSRRLRQRS